MAVKNIPTRVDDINGEDGAVTIPFGIKDVSYEIDLTAKNQSAFDKAMKPWLKHARVVSTSKPTRRTNGRTNGVTNGHKNGAKKPPVKRPDYAAVRKWAAETGREVAVRGRLSSDLLAEYDKEMATAS